MSLVLTKTVYLCKNTVNQFIMDDLNIICSEAIISAFSVKRFFRNYSKMLIMLTYGKIPASLPETQNQFESPAGFYNCSV